jgi:hypothetical protein
MKVGLLIGIAVLAAPQLAMAVISFHQLDEDLFVVSHRVKVKFWTSRGQAVKKVYEKAASLCVAAGYSHLEILHQESEAEQWVDDANASLQIRFFPEAGKERLDCRRTASDRYIEQAAVKLVKRGYRPPPPPADSSTDAQTDSGSARSD